MRNFCLFIALSEAFWRMGGFDFVFLRRLYDRPYLVCDAADWWRELDFEHRHGRASQCLRFSRRHNLEFFALPHRDRGDKYASIPESWCKYEQQKTLVVSNPFVFSYITDLYRRITEVQRLMICQIAEIQYSVLSMCVCVCVQLVMVSCNDCSLIV